MAWIHRAPVTPIGGLGDELGPTNRPRNAKSVPAVGEEEGTRVDGLASCFCLATGIGEATSAASGSGGERQSRRKCRHGDEPEADGLATNCDRS
jgi:hypothetical protein